MNHTEGMPRHRQQRGAPEVHYWSQSSANETSFAEGGYERRSLPDSIHVTRFCFWKQLHSIHVVENRIFVFCVALLTTAMLSLSVAR